MAGTGQPPAPRDTSWDYDDDDVADDAPLSSDERDEDRLDRDRCVLGEACLVADPYHSADECFDEEMARHFMGEESSNG